MESFKIENLSFNYPNKLNKAISDVNITVNQGEFILIIGKSGCGKTTLLRLLKSSLSPFGVRSGEIYFNGKLINDCSLKEEAAEIGFVMQNPDNQIVTDKVWHELAFGLESLGYSTDEIRARVSETASFFGIQNWFYKNTTELSGGQKQLLNLASVIVMQPSVLILDEPTSQLDPISSQEFLKMLEKVNRELGITVILAEHRIEEAFHLSDRVIVMDEGRVIADELPKRVGEILKRENSYMYHALPVPVRIFGEVENGAEYPLTVRDTRLWFENYAKEHTLKAALIEKPNNPFSDTEPIIEIKDAWYRYEKNLPDVIKGLNMSVKKGELFSIVGGNGTGKTTALSLIAALNKPYRGEVFINGQSIFKVSNLYNGLLGMLPQNPQSVFVKNTVYLDLMEVLSEKKLSEEEKEKRVQAISKLCHINNLLNSHPYDLSGGEQQRAALSKILLSEPQILLLDEPTKGMDAHFKTEFAEILEDLKASGVTIVMVSHDIEFCAEFADRCAMFFDGSITSIGEPREFFSGKSFYTTSANRIARKIIPGAVTADDVIYACTGVVKKKEKKPQNIEFNNPINESKTKKKINKEVIKTSEPERKLTKRTLITSFLIILLIPLTIYFGNLFFGSRKYYLISFLIIIETIIPFCMAFESRKPKAREIVVISVLCAIAVAGRAAFFMLPQFKPVVALIIISGVCFGGETGFLVGIITGFISNFFFGQGPWTPWQMFTLGVIGFISGIIFKKGFLRKTKISLSVFGFLSTLFIYGGIMNPASILMYQNVITKEMIMTSYVAGFGLDLIHSFSTAFFLWFISLTMIEKLERIKAKYGMVHI